TTQQAKELLAGTDLGRSGIVLASADWHPGVVGIVAGRLAEQFARPAVVIALKPGDAVATGSGRSVPGFPLHEALRACDAYLLGHGGHAAAAGVKVAPDRIDGFRECFNAYVAAHFPGGPPAPRLTLDAEVPLSALTFGLLKDIDRLEPYGADRKSTRLNSSHRTISYAVFCLKKKNNHGASHCYSLPATSSPHTRHSL